MIYFGFFSYHPFIHVHVSQNNVDMVIWLMHVSILAVVRILTLVPQVGTLKNAHTRGYQKVCTLML